MSANVVATAQKHRRSVCDLINTLEQTVDKDDDWERLLDLIHQLVVEHPQVLMSARSTHAITGPFNQHPTKEHGFLLLIIGSLLRVVCLTSVTSLEGKIAKTLKEIFQLAQIRDHMVFCYLLKELVKLVSDLSEICHVDYLKEQYAVEERIHFPIVLSHFQHAWNVKQAAKLKDNTEMEELDYEPWLVEIHSYHQLNVLLSCALDLAVIFPRDLSQFCKEEVDKLYHAIGNCLEFSCLDVKQRMLSLLASILPRMKMENSRVEVDHLIWCTLALMTIPPALQASSENLLFVTSLVDALEAFFLPDEGSPIAVLRFWSLLFVNLTSNLDYKVFPSMSPEFQICVGKLLLQCYQLNIGDNGIHDILALFGFASNIQPLVPSLVVVTKGSISQPMIQDESKVKADGRSIQKGRINRIFPTLPDHLLKLVDRVVLCSSELFDVSKSSRSEKSKTDIDKMLCCAEGIRAGLELYARLIVDLGENFTYPWWTAEQLKQFCTSWEKSLYDITASSFGAVESQKKFYFNKVFDKVMDSVGTLGVCMSNSVHMNSAMVDRCLWIVMLPWQQQISNQDTLGAGSSLSQLQRDFLRKTSSELIDSSCKISSLDALSSLPAYTFSVPKKVAFSAALKSKDSEVIVGSLKSLSLIMSTLEKDAIQPLLKSFSSMITDDVKVLETLIGELVPLAISCAGADTKRLHYGDDFTSAIHKSCKLDITPETHMKGESELILLTMKMLSKVTDLQLLMKLVKTISVLASHLENPSIVTSRCLSLFTHSDAQLRLVISHNIQMFFPESDPPLEMAQLESHPVFAKLKTIEKENGIQAFTVTAYGNIARFAKGNLFIMCLYRLLNSLSCPSFSIKSTTYAQLRIAAKANNLTLLKMLSQYQMPICEFMVGEVCDQTSVIFCSDKKKNVFHQVSQGFGIKDISEFFKIVSDSLIPLLVCRATTQASQALKYIAASMKTILRSLLVESIKHIFLYIVKHGQQQDLNTVSKFFKLEADFEMTNLLQADSKSILNLLLLNLSSHRRRVLAAIKLLAEMKQTSLVYDSEDIIPEYLHPHLHGIVAYFNIVLVRRDYFENREKRKQAISSLTELMSLMGPKYITDVKLKIIAMLRQYLTLKDPEITNLTLSAWKCFINSVDVASLSPLLSQIVVALSPFIPSHPQTVTEIFEFLIIENSTLLKPYFNQIYHMPDSPELDQVNRALKDHSNATKSLHEELHYVLKGVLHERLDVRGHALKALHKLLKTHRAKLERYIAGSDRVDPIVTEIVTTLMQSLRGASPDMREDYAVCFGELGAIDPGKLEIPMSSSAQNVPFYEVDADFAVDLLGELVRAYLAATSISYQDCCAYAMQEILTLCKCKNDDPDSEGFKIWTSLSTESQEVLRPHLTSSYSAVVPKGSYPKMPFFQSSKNVTFHSWIQQWCSFLIHKLPDGLTKTMFLPCSLVFQHDKSMAVYLLPYLLITILKLGINELDQLIHKEIMAVLNHCAQDRDLWQEQTDCSIMCAQTIFTVLDYLNAWAIGKNKTAAIRRLRNQPQKGNQQEVSNVFKYLQSIPKEMMAHSAFRCQAYTRSLMYLESYLSSNPSAIQSNLQFLQRIYVALDDYDSVAGVMAVRTSSSTLSEQILEYKCVGNYRSAAACYEKIIKAGPDDIAHHVGMLDCMMRQGEFTSASMHVNGLQSKKPEWSQRLNSFRVEASWKLGKWDDLETYLKEEPYGSKNWDINLGRLLLAAKQQDYKNFMEQLGKVRAEQMVPLCTASVELGSYQRGYDYIVRLHMLHELEEGVNWLLGSETSHSQSPILHIWETRSNLIQESFRTQEPILSLRRVILGLTLRHEKEITKYWLKSAKIARRAGHLQTAHSFLLNTKSKDYTLPEVEIEWAEYKKTQSSSYEALVGLQKAVDELWPDQEGAAEIATKNPAHADALLLIGHWMEDTAHVESQTIIKQYKKGVSVYPESEDGHFYLGKYYDRLMGVLASDRPAKSAEFLQFIIRHYGNCLEYGNKYIYQCMPRMLTLWLDFGSFVPDSGVSSSSRRSQDRERIMPKYGQYLTQLNELMEGIRDRLPPYQFLIAFSQLISRICHPNSQVFKILEEIVLKLLEHYAQQALWMMIAVSKSTHADRESKCRRILEKAKQKLPHCVKLIDDMEKLCDRLLEVCNKSAEPSKNHSMDTICRGLVRLTSSSGFSAIMVPLQSSMNVTLPGAGARGMHNPFPGPQPTIERFDDKVEVLGSLQRPKKITVLASDGCSYVLLCKPKDDLRKDARLMEFNSLVNKCLRKDHESRLRRLHIRTYAVIPLNEECGLLEWVPNTHGFRNILLKLYQEKGILMTSREMKDIMKNAGNDSVRKKEAFLKELLPKHPPVFGEWFMRTFADPTSWYSSRQAYAHTSAVISMVGYVLGLGDRHGENVLYDSTTGDCIHVDFNCLFNRGETFDVPEVVPFRLTHNMVHGLGVTGCEGPFRKSCEAAMKVLRQESDALICVLKTFIHDPLVEWEKVKGRPTSAESTNEKAIKIVRDIEDRLQGKLSHKKGLPLSVEGHVHALIKEATDINNLSKMYIGWAPFM